MILVYPVLPVASSFGGLNVEIPGWDVLVGKLDELQQSMPDPQNTYIFALKYQDASTPACYMPRRHEGGTCFLCVLAPSWLINSHQGFGSAQ